MSDVNGDNQVIYPHYLESPCHNVDTLLDLLKVIVKSRELLIVNEMYTVYLGVVGIVGSRLSFSSESVKVVTDVVIDDATHNVISNLVEHGLDLRDANISFTDIVEIVVDGTVYYPAWLGYKNDAIDGYGNILVNEDIQPGSIEINTKSLDLFS